MFYSLIHLFSFVRSTDSEMALCSRLFASFFVNGDDIIDSEKSAQMRSESRSGGQMAGFERQLDPVHPISHTAFDRSENLDDSLQLIPQIIMARL